MSTVVQNRQKPGFRIQNREGHDELHELVYDRANGRISQSEALDRYGEITRKVRTRPLCFVFFGFGCLPWGGRSVIPAGTEVPLSWKPDPYFGVDNPPPAGSDIEG